MTNQLKFALDEGRTNKCANCGIFQTALLTHCALKECVCVCEILDFFVSFAMLSFGVHCISYADVETIKASSLSLSFIRADIFVKRLD